MSTKNDEKTLSPNNSTMRSFTKKGIRYKYDPWTKTVYNPKTNLPYKPAYSVKLINQHKTQLGGVEKATNSSAFLGSTDDVAGINSRMYKNRRVYQIPDKNGSYTYRYVNKRLVPKQTLAQIQDQNIFDNDHVKKETMHFLGQFHKGMRNVIDSYKMNESLLGVRNHFKDGRTETFMTQKEILNFFNRINTDAGFFREQFLPQSNLMDDMLSNDQWEELYQKQKKGGYEGVDVFLTKISEISAVDIIDFRNGKEHLVSRYRTGFFFDRYNETQVDLSIFQIYSKDQFDKMMSNEDTVIEDCFIHALRQYGYGNSDFAKIYLHLTPPFSAKSALPAIAKLLDCYFVTRRVKSKSNKVDTRIIPRSLDTVAKRTAYEKAHNITLKKVTIGDHNKHWFADDKSLYSSEIKDLLVQHKEKTFFGFIRNNMNLFSTELQGTTQFYLQAQKLNHTYKFDFDNLDPDIENDCEPSLTQKQIQAKYKTIDNILYLNEIDQRIDGVFTHTYSFLYKNQCHTYDITTEHAIKKAKRMALRKNLTVVYRVGKKNTEDFNKYINKNNLTMFKANTNNGIYEKRNVDTTRFYFADFETITQNKAGVEMKHKFTLGAISNLHDNTVTSFYTMEEFLDFLPDHSKVFFHNLKYDHTQLVANKNVTVKDRLMVSGSMLFSRIMYFGKTIYLQDSYKMISTPLVDFGEMFTLDTKKEAISFTLYNKLHWKNKRHTTINKFNAQMKKEGKFDDIDEKTVEKFTCYRLKDGTFTKEVVKNRASYIDYTAYMKYYCERDVDVLKQGWIKFREWNIEAFDLDIAKYFTIGSLARDILEKNLCFEECYTLNSISKAYVRKCLIGGRTMTKDNEKIHTADILLAIDATSLYPSSMRLGKGFAKGKPKFYRHSTTENLQQILDKSDYYLGKFKIITHPKDHLEAEIPKNMYLDQPVLSYINEDGVRMFVNQLPPGYDKYIWMDSQTLEDGIEFQGYTFEPVHAMVWNDGFNTNIHNTIQTMFDTRVKKKIEENPAQLIFKLIMNSSYGKLSMKDIRTQSRTFKNYELCLDQLKIEEPGLALFKLEDIHKYKDHPAYKSLCYVKNLKKLHDDFVGHSFFHITQVETTDFYTHYTLKKNSLSESQNANYPHLATYVLSYSKHLMNQVVEACRATNVEILMGDTDSLHVAAKNVPQMYEYYKKKYHHDLTPENEGLGGFTEDYATQATKVPLALYKPIINEELLEKVPRRHLESKIFNGWAIDSYFYEKKAYVEHLITREKQFLCHPKLTDNHEKIYIFDADGEKISIINEDGEPDFVYKTCKNQYGKKMPIKDKNNKKIKMCDSHGNQLYKCFESFNTHFKGVPKSVIDQKAFDLVKQPGDIYHQLPKETRKQLLFQGTLLLAQKFDQGVGVEFDLAKRLKGVCMDFANDGVKNHIEGVFTRKVIFDEKYKAIQKKKKNEITKDDQEFLNNIEWI